MSSCLTGRAYGFDLENIVKWQSATFGRTTSHPSSPSSTLSESTNSPVLISNRKPRTPRKRPNQTYNEAVALLYTACPTIFSNKQLTSSNKNLPNFTKTHTHIFNQPPELISPFRAIENAGFLLQPVVDKPSCVIEPKVVGLCQSPVDIGWNFNSGSNTEELGDGYEDDFDTESMLDEEIEEGIDSIMGNSDSIVESNEDVFCDFKNGYGYPIGLGFGEFNSGFGMRNGVRALRNVGEGSWSFPAMEVVRVPTAAPSKPKKAPVEKKKVKKVEDLMKRSEWELGSGFESFSPESGSRLWLKLNYDAVLNAWSDKGSPLPVEIIGSESSGGDTYVKMDMIGSVSNKSRYKEKKHGSLCSKKIPDRRSRSKVQCLLHQYVYLAFGGL